MMNKEKRNKRSSEMTRKIRVANKVRARGFNLLFTMGYALCLFLYSRALRGIFHVVCN